MARLYMAGAETGHSHAEGYGEVSSSPLFETTTVRSGTRSWRISGGAAGTTAALASSLFTGTLGTSYFLSVWMLIPSASGYPTTAFGCVRLLTGTATLLGEIRLQTTGAVQLYRGATAIGSPTAALAMDTWHRLDLMVKIDTGATDAFEGRLNGTSFASASAVSQSDTTVGGARWGVAAGPGINKIFYFDDVILNDSTGSVHATYPGDEKVVLLLPTADSARDAGWVAGASATTNLWEAVNNTPPVGVANASATAASQIRNAVNTTTEAYSATMRTYTAAGISAGDTVTAVQPIIAHGPSTTAAITTGVQLTSNPTIAEATPATGAVAAALYPTGWTRGVTTIAENPTVTLGTAPVMRVRKNTAATTSTNVCLMAMYVSYTVGTGTTTTTPAPGAGTRYRFILALLLFLLWRRR